MIISKIPKNVSNACIPMNISMINRYFLDVAVSVLINEKLSLIYFSSI